MLPITYQDSVSTDSTHTNWRVDALDGKYILRACEFTHAGKNWKLSNDVTFEGDAGNTECYPEGWLTAKPDGTVSLVVMDRLILKKIAATSPEDKRLLDQYYQVVGRERLLPVFYTIKQHYVVATKTLTRERSLLVSRCLKRDTISADKIDPVPTPTIDIAFEESHPAIEYAPVLRARLNYTKTQQAELADISKKSWDRLNSSEQARVMREAAERMGIIQKFPAGTEPKKL